MKSPVTRDKYQKRLGKFFDFLTLEGSTIEDRSKVFVEMARKDSNWTFSNILKFIQFQNSRVIRKEISGATVRNYVKSIKLFCEMADLPIAWKKITRGLPRGRGDGHENSYNMINHNHIDGYFGWGVYRRYECCYRHLTLSGGLCQSCTIP